jgi:hypothetical protein
MTMTALGLLASLALAPAGASADSASVNDNAAVQATAQPAASTPPAASTKPPMTDADLGTSVIGRFFRYQVAEMGQTGSPITDPNAPSSRRDGWTPQPENAPPMPFTEWPYGGATSLGVNRPNSVDSPLMVALGKTGLGQAMSAAHIQAYGWVDVGGNISTSNRKQGNSPGAYDYNPNTVQMDQAVLYLERTPDTVQTDHVDWGFRVAAIYGTDYRYTVSDGLFSGQYLTNNKSYGFDLPMVYADIYIPKVAKGLELRIGRYIALPDIEAQLAPNNYMYSHSLAYSFDNYTNTGIQATLALSKNLFLQLGVSAGSDTAFWNTGKHIANPYPSPLYPGQTFRKDPGAQPSFTGCLRYQTDSARDAVYACADAINSGTWGYNNLQWFGLTYYHKFTDKWHISFETYNLYETKVPNINNAAVQTVVANGGTPFAGLKYNAPNMAQCHDPNALTCTAKAFALLAYTNYQPSPRDNISLRTEYYNDEEGQRTGIATRYYDIALGLQHWFSPQIEFRPEVAYYRSIDAAAFNGDGALGIAPDKNHQLVLSGDVIVHF